jgi:enoyl-CoA hydratase/carnithine racemase
MSKFTDYKDAYQTIKLERSKDGILQMTLHNNGGPYVWDFAGVVRDKQREHTGGAHQELSEAIGQIARDEENRIVIMIGTGELFSGPPANEDNFRDNYPRGGPEYWEPLRFHGTNLTMGMLDIPGPVISCINGPAYRHAEIPIMADIVLAAQDALIQDSGHFPNRLVPGDGINLIMPFLMGWTRGRYFHLTGQKLSAEELKQLGLVNEVMPRDRLLPRAWEIAEQLIKNNPLALRYTKLVLTAPLKSFVQQYLGYGFAMESLAAIYESSGTVGYKWD